MASRGGIYRGPGGQELYGDGREVTPVRTRPPDPVPADDPELDRAVAQVDAIASRLAAAGYTPGSPAPRGLWELYFDGLCEPRNPGGVMSWGWGLVCASTGELFTGMGSRPAAPGNTNNQAEYFALGTGLAAVRERFKGWFLPQPQRPPAERYAGLVIRGDSKLVVEQISGRWRINIPALAKLHARCHALLADLNRLGPWQAEWIPREQNKLADEKSRQAYRELTGQDAPVRRGKGE